MAIQHKSPPISSLPPPSPPGRQPQLLTSCRRSSIEFGAETSAGRHRRDLATGPFRPAVLDSSGFRSRRAPATIHEILPPVLGRRPTSRPGRERAGYRSPAAAASPRLQPRFTWSRHPDPNTVSVGHPPQNVPVLLGPRGAPRLLLGSLEGVVPLPSAITPALLPRPLPASPPSAPSGFPNTSAYW